MIKILFLIHDLGQGGAEKVLVNLVNHMDPSKFDISVTALYGGGMYAKNVASHIHYRAVFPKALPGNSKRMKLLSPELLHRICVKEHYDIEVAYLEGPSARVISGCRDSNTKLVSWIHVEQHTQDKISASFRSMIEAIKCYNRFDHTVCVSKTVREDFIELLDFKKSCSVLYNTVDSKSIIAEAADEAAELSSNNGINIVAVGTLKKSKGYLRLLSIILKLFREEYNIHLFILGSGPLEKEIKNFVECNGIAHVVTLLGYQENPYRIVSKCDLLVCASFAEGFSTAVTEALIVGTPVCTVDVSGMRELLGENNEYGVVTNNDEEALYQGIRQLLDNPDLLLHYKSKAKERGKIFNTEETVKQVEGMLLSLWGDVNECH